jgi:hypothetical protein
VALLEWAGEKLTALRATSPKPKEYSVAWPQYALDPHEAYGYTGESLRPNSPTSAEITAMDEILSWLNFIPDPAHRRAVALRILIHPIRQRHLLMWTHIARIMGTGPHNVRYWYDKGIAHLVGVLPKDAVAKSVALLGLG